MEVVRARSSDDFFVLFFVFLQSYKESEDPSKYHSEKTGRGPLVNNWKVRRRKGKNGNMHTFFCFGTGS